MELGGSWKFCCFNVWYPSLTSICEKRATDVFVRNGFLDFWENSTIETINRPFALKNTNKTSRALGLKSNTNVILSLTLATVNHFHSLLVFRWSLYSQHCLLPSDPFCCGVSCSNCLRAYGLPTYPYPIAHIWLCDVSLMWLSHV
jgi:hypothetical protein